MNKRIFMLLMGTFFCTGLVSAMPEYVDTSYMCDCGGKPEDHCYTITCPKTRCVPVYKTEIIPCCKKEKKCKKRCKTRCEKPRCERNNGRSCGVRC